MRAHYREHGTRQYVEATAIRATGTTCPRARHVAYAYAHKGTHFRRVYDLPDGYFSLTAFLAGPVLGFRCAYHRLGDDSGDVACRRAGRVVRFGRYDSSPFH